MADEIDDRPVEVDDRDKPTDRVHSVHLTPNWTDLLPGLIGMIRNATSVEAYKEAERNLHVMAYAADQYVAAQKAERKREAEHAPAEWEANP